MTEQSGKFEKPSSRRELLKGTLLAGVGGAVIMSGVNVIPAMAAVNDAAILNGALDLEHQAIWAYSFAAGKLSDTDVGRTVKALALRNQADHIRHRDALISVIKGLGKTPSPAKDSYDVSPYIKVGEGNLDSDANIAKLALALEVDAAIAYGDAFSKLKAVPHLQAAATIAPDEAAHAAAIRGVFKTLIPSVEYVPAAFLSADTRSQWILKV
jgi:rubrerythrin